MGEISYFCGLLMVDDVLSIVRVDTAGYGYLLGSYMPLKCGSDGHMGQDSCEMCRGQVNFTVTIHEQQALLTEQIACTNH